MKKETYHIPFMSIYVDGREPIFHIEIEPVIDEAILIDGEEVLFEGELFKFIGWGTGLKGKVRVLRVRVSPRETRCLYTTSPVDGFTYSDAQDEIWFQKTKSYG